MSPLQLRRGTTAEVAAYGPVVGEPVFDRELNILTIGGFPLSQVATALKLHTARTLGVSGTVTGSGSFDGSGNLTISTSVGASLQALLDAKAPLASPALTGTPTGPTASAGTSTTQLATTAFVTSADNLKANLASPPLTGTPTAPTAAVGTNTTQLATTAMVQAEIANKRAWTPYTPTMTPTSGTFTSISATGEYMVAFGICFVRITVTVTTKGTGTFPMATLPVVGKTGSAGMLLVAREGSTGKMGNGLLTSARDQVYISGYDASDLSITGAVIILNGSYPVA